MSYSYENIKVLEGKTLKRIVIENDEVIFTTKSGESFKMYHSQDYCEHVELEEVIGNVYDLLGSPILKAEERVPDDTPPKIEEGYDHMPDSHTWTFYELATVKGYVTLRWYGTSNGYYSEGVNFEKVV